MYTRIYKVTAKQYILYKDYIKSYVATMANSLCYDLGLHTFLLVLTMKTQTIKIMTRHLSI